MSVPISKYKPDRIERFFDEIAGFIGKLTEIIVRFSLEILFFVFQWVVILIVLHWGLYLLFGIEFFK